MTLTTHLRIVEPTPVRPVFDEARRLLHAENAAFSHEKNLFGSDMTYRNHPGQGYSALLWVSYGADGPLEAGCDECECLVLATCTCEPAFEHRHGTRDPAASISVAFDTPYGAEGHCDLHTYLVREMGKWLTDRGLTWFWENEFEGEWYAGPTNLESLGDPDKGSALVHRGEEWPLAALFTGAETC